MPWARAGRTSGRSPPPRSCGFRGAVGSTRPVSPGVPAGRCKAIKHLGCVSCRIGFRFGRGFFDWQFRWMSTDYSSPCSEGDPPVKRGTAQATCQESVSLWCVCTIWVRPPFSRPAISNLRNRSRTACFGLLPKGKTPIAGSTGYR